MSLSTIRNSHLDDLQEISKLYLQSEEFHHANRGDILSVSNETDRLSTFSKFLQDAQITNLVLEHEHKIIGYARFRIINIPMISFLTMGGKKKVLIEDVVVSEKWRRQGLAKRLIAEIESRATASGVTWMQLHVFTFNTPA